MTPSQNIPLKTLEEQLKHKREKIYPRMVTGKFALFRVTAAGALLGLYYLLAWLNYDGRQAILFDLPERKFYIFGMILWPQDFIYLTAILVIAALTLFFFTALAGRVWCGYACPQTVWTESFLWIERKVEGDRPQQIKLDNSPWNLNKITRKTIKHSIWIAFALWTGFTFVGYFTPIRELTEKVFSFSTGPWETFWVLFYGLATYGNAGWLREAVCIYMCPYARFQSAMFDKDTLIVSYDKSRGEPRGSRKRSSNPEQLGLGSCINCTMCVQVCPTGIDIRDGLQYQCISCAACIDVCDDIMDKMNYPKGLIKYTTENALANNPAQRLRPRVIFYGVFLILIISLLIFNIKTRSKLELDVLRDRNSLYRETTDGQIENVYTLRIINKDQVEHRFSVQAQGLDNLQVLSDDGEIYLPAGEVEDFIIRLSTPQRNLENKNSDIDIILNAQDDERIVVVKSTRFIGPVE